MLLLLLTGEALIIICFLIFGKNLDTNILTLNIIVATIIYTLYTLEALFPMVDLKDKSQKTIGSLGIKMFTTLWYTLFAIGAMIFFIINKPIDFNIQIIIHGILVFFLFLGLYFALSASDKANAIYINEKSNRNLLDEMKRTTKEVQLKLNQLKDIPGEILSRTISLQENLRFISPSNNPEANDLELNYLKEIKAVYDSLFEMPLNHDKIIGNIQKCETTYKERKQIFSN